MWSKGECSLMKARVERTRRVLDGRTRLTGALLLALLAALMVVGLTSAANPSAQGLFELDGNGFTTASSTAADWNCLFAVNPANCSGAPMPAASTHVTDPTLDSGDTILGQGSKDILPLSQWTPVTQKPPAKDDIANAAWANYAGPGGHDFVYFSADRISNNGDAFLGFWFFKDKIGVSNGAFTGQHQDGDILVLVNFIQGQGANKISGATQEIGVFKWVSDGSGDINGGTLKTLVPLTQGTCPAGGDACAIFNTTSQTSTWPFQSTDSGDAANTWTPSEFVEGGIDLTALLADQGCFSSVMAETRSSDSPTAEQKDIVLGSLSTCGTVKIVKNAVPDDARSWGFSAADGLAPASFGLVDNGGATNTQEFDNVNPGTYHVSEDAFSALGWALSDVSCDDANNTPSSGSVATRTATIDVGPSEVVTCTFTNTFTKGTPVVTTTATAGPVVVGSNIHDVAHLSGGLGNPTGSITFDVFAPGDTNCTTPISVSPSKPVSGAGDYQSGDYAAGAVGTYRWVAHYSGDSLNNAVDTLCTDANESTVVTKASPAISTSASGPVVVGDKIHDVATLSGAVGATGAVTFQVFAPGDTSCSEAVATLATSSKSVDGNGNGTYTSADFTTAASGDYRWRAFFAGDAKNDPVSGACNAVNEKSTVFKPGIFISKTTSTPQVVSGGTATFSITVKNTGDVTLTNVHVTDAQAPNCVRTAAQIAADRGSSTFAPNDSYTYSCTLANVTQSLTNVATDTGTPPVGPDQSATDQASVTVIHPSIAITKTTSTPTLLSGGTATFEITVENTGDVALTSVHVSDAQAPGCARTAAQVAADRGSSTFAPDDVYTYSCTLANVTANVTNTATDTGTPPVGPDVTDSDSASVAAIHPAITITKGPGTQAVDSGGTANFTITVKNTGDVTLTSVTVTDPLSTGCSKSLGTLTPGQSTSYACSQAGVTAAFTNVATVTGHPPLGPDVTASASANVTLNPPPSSPPATPTATPAPTVVDLAVVKTADPASVLLGGNVTYTLTVTNNGPVTDTGVQVADSLPAGVGFVSVASSQGTCTGGSLVQCNLGTMTNGQKVTITIVAKTAATGSITNTATVVGALPETTLANNTSSAPITVTAPPQPKPKPKPKPAFKPPVVKPKPKPVPPACYAVAVTPKSLSAGKSGKLQLRVSARNKAVSGVKVRVTGPGILKLSGRTNAAGKVTVLLHPKKAGIVLVKPAAYKGCTSPRVGVVAAFTPPVTG
jgi:uncharacterized repeat protein (TIGR01451 family)